MPNRYLIANWKMNLPPEGVERYLDAVKDADVVIAPPYVFLKDVAARFANVAAQNCADQKSGAFTGEVSADMLRDCGAQFVIIGHSERRTIYGEDDALIAHGRIDGFLVGGASLDSKKFLALAAAMNLRSTSQDDVMI